MRRKISIEQEREIFRRRGEKLIDLAEEYGVAYSSIRNILRKHSSLSFEFRSPSGTASSFPANFVNGQASHPPQVHSNGMHPSMLFPPIPLAREGAYTSARPSNPPSGTNMFGPAQVAYNPPEMYQNELQSNTHSAYVPFVQEGRAATSARPWSRQGIIHAASPTFSIEQEWGMYRRYINGDSEKILASVYGVHPSLICRLIQKCHRAESADTGVFNCNAIPRHAVYGQSTYPSQQRGSSAVRREGAGASILRRRQPGTGRYVSCCLR
jgi:hypothetical protein